MMIGNIPISGWRNNNMRIFICKTCIREAEINPLTDLVECPVCHQSGANIYSIREILQQIKDSMIAINEIKTVLGI